MVERDHGVELPVGRPEEDRVGRDGAGRRRTEGPGPGERGQEELRLVVAERAAVAGVGVERGEGEPRAVTAARIAETVAIADRALRRDFGLSRPRIAVCALDPHAGDEGAIGRADARVVAPAVARARAAGARVSGPHPSDSLFFRAAAGEFDAVVALYHDQGLIPVKLLDAVGGDPAVNVTLGLPIVRTSPDHGVAYDLAGTGKASPASMIAALRLAARIARVRATKPVR